MRTFFWQQRILPGSRVFQRVKSCPIWRAGGYGEAELLEAGMEYLFSLRGVARQWSHSSW